MPLLLLPGRSVKWQGLKHLVQFMVVITLDMKIFSTGRSWRRLIEDRTGEGEGGGMEMVIRGRFISFCSLCTAWRTHSHSSTMPYLYLLFEGAMTLLPSTHQWGTPWPSSFTPYLYLSHNPLPPILSSKLPSFKYFSLYYSYIKFSKWGARTIWQSNVAH